MIKRFNPNSVKMSNHLSSPCEKALRQFRREYKQALEWSDGKQVVRVREYLAPVKEGFTARGFKRRNNKLVGLSHEKRLLVLECASAAEAKRVAREATRVAFFAELTAASQS